MWKKTQYTHEKEKKNSIIGLQMFQCDIFLHQKDKEIGEKTQ